MIALPRLAPPTGALLLLLGAAGGLAGCRGQEQDGNAAQKVAAPEQPASNAAAASVQPETLDRAALLEAVRLAASASATGADDREVQRRLDGRQFELRIRFGCAGPSESLKSASLGWSFDETKRTLRVRAAPTITAGQPDVAAIAPEGTEAIEGFWIQRPWVVDAACPKAPAAQPPSEPGAADAKESSKPAGEPLQPETPSGARVGIAEFFNASDARTGRRDQRAYESTKVVEEGRAPAGQGFDLVLSGRLRALGTGKVINCTALAPDRAPDCIVSANFDQVWIEWPDGRQVVAQWSRD